MTASNSPETPRLGALDTLASSGKSWGLPATESLLQEPLAQQREQRQRLERRRHRWERMQGALAAIVVFASALHFGPSFGIPLLWNMVLGIVLGTLVGSFWPPQRTV